jgi:phage-related protein
VYKDHVVSAIAKFEDDIVNEVEIFFEGLDKSILCTIEKQKKLNGVIIETE